MVAVKDSRLPIAILIWICSVIQFCLFRYVLVLNPESRPEVFFPIGALVASSFLAILILRSPCAASAVAFGFLPGVFLGLVETMSITFETAPQIPAWLQKNAPPTSMAAMIMLFGMAGSLAYRGTSSFGLSLLNGLNCAIVGTSLTCTFGLAYTFAFRSELAEAAHTMASRVLANAVTGSWQHWLFAPILAVIFSGLGALCEAKLRNYSRTVALYISSVAAVFFAAGLTLLIYASGLPRANRPPFVMFGMLALATTLAAAYSIVASILQTDEDSAARSCCSGQAQEWRG
jgi:hypothetical protein